MPPVLSEALLGSWTVTRGMAGIFLCTLRARMTDFRYHNGALDQFSFVIPCRFAFFAQFIPCSFALFGSGGGGGRESSPEAGGGGGRESSQWMFQKIQSPPSMLAYRRPPFLPFPPSPPTDPRSPRSGCRPH